MMQKKTLNKKPALLRATVLLFLFIMGSYLVPVFANSDPEKMAATTIFTYQVIDASMAGDCKKAGKIDGDAFPDLVIGGMKDNNEPLTWYRYPDWEKTVIAMPNHEFTTDCALGDVDSDGSLDIIVPDGDTGNNLVWFKNPGADHAMNGSSWARFEIGAIGGWGKDVAPADYDQNGKLDVATRTADTVMIFFQNNSGTWTKKTFSGRNTGSEGMSMGDVNQDDHIDLILRGVWLRNPGGTAAQTTTSWTQYTIDSVGAVDTDFKALVVDLNQNGVMDVLFSSSEHTASVDWWSPANGNPTGAWTRHTILSSVEKAHTLQAADMDGDNDIDVVIGQMHTSAAREIMVMHNQDGVGTSWAKQVIGTNGLHNGVVVDIGTDGDYDVFGSNWTGNPPLKLWINSVQINFFKYWTYKQVTNTHQQTFGLAFADLNSDDHPDIISGQYWYTNPGGDLTGNWTQSPFPTGMNSNLSVDVDNDPYPDVIAQKQETNLSLYWLEAANSEATTWNAIKIGEVPNASHTLGSQGYRVGNIDGDAKQEILVSTGTGNGTGNGGIYYFRIPSTNPTNGNWEKIRLSANPSDEGFALGDIDQDGDQDVAASTGSLKTIQWYRNPGNGTANWQALTIGSLPADAEWPDRTEMADFNGDRKLDIITTEENGLASSAETYWWIQPANPTSSNWTRNLVVSQGSTNSMGVGDLNQDGLVEVILAEHKGELSLTIWEELGLGVPSKTTIFQGKESHLGAQLVDLDGDQDLDIVSIAYDAPQDIHLWRNDNPILSSRVFLPTVRFQLPSAGSLVIPEQDETPVSLAEPDGPPPAAIIVQTGVSALENQKPAFPPGLFWLALGLAAVFLTGLLIVWRTRSKGKHGR